MKLSERETTKTNESHTAILQGVIARWKRGELSSEDFTFYLVGLSGNTDALEKKVAQLEAGKPDCIWTYDDNFDYWETTCENVFSLMSGGTPIENDMYYCPYCGGRLLDEAIGGD